MKNFCDNVTSIVFIFIYIYIYMHKHIYIQWTNKLALTTSLPCVSFPFYRNELTVTFISFSKNCPSFTPVSQILILSHIPQAIEFEFLLCGYSLEFDNKWNRIFPGTRGCEGWPKLSWADVQIASVHFQIPQSLLRGQWFFVLWSRNSDFMKHLSCAGWMSGFFDCLLYKPVACWPYQCFIAVIYYYAVVYLCK